MRNGQQVETVVDRALTIAMTEPRGPVYLSLPREVLAAPLDPFQYNSPSRQRPAAPPHADPDAVDAAAAMVAAAENPLIITVSAGQDTDAVAPLGALAERFAIPVIQYRPRYMSLASDHPMNLGYEPGPLLAKADVVIVIDCAVPWIPASHETLADAKIIHIGTDPLHQGLPIRGFPCDLAITSRTAAALRLLEEALAEHENKAKSRIDKRRQALAERREEQRANWRAVIERGKTEVPLHPAWISHCIGQVKGEDAIVMKESPLARPFIDFNQPGTYFGIGAASGLGWGMGGAVGAKLAAPERLVIGTEGDGAYMFGNPVSAHYVAAELGLPILTVIYNNSRWQAVRRATTTLYPDGYAARSNQEPLTYFDGVKSRFEKVVEVSGGYGEQVTDPAELPGALDRALKAVTVEKRSAVLNVVCGAE